SKSKDYPKCIELITRWVIRYDGLSAATQRNFNGWKSGMYYNLACYYALTGQKPMALESFNTAVASGYSDYADTMTDTDLTSVRAEPEFKNLLLTMREKGDDPYVLKISGPYDRAGTGDEISKFKNLLLWVHNAVRHDGNSNNPAQVNGDSLIMVCKAQNRGVN